MCDRGSLCSVGVRSFYFRGSSFFSFNVPRNYLKVYCCRSVSKRRVSPCHHLATNYMGDFVKKVRPYGALVRGGVPIHSISVRVAPTCCSHCLGRGFPGRCVSPRRTFDGVTLASHFPRVVRMLHRVTGCGKGKVTTGLFCRKGMVRTVSLVVRCGERRSDAPSIGVSGTSLHTLRGKTTCVGSRFGYSVSISRLSRVAYVNQAGLGLTFGRICNISVARCVRREQLDRTRALLSLASFAVRRITTTINCGGTKHFTDVFGGDANICPTRCEGVTRRGWGRHRKRL